MKRFFLPVIIYFGKRIEKKRFSKPAIYIGGCGRSGTTLLLSILSAHKDIFACPKELDLFNGSSLDENGLKIPKFYRLYRTFIFNRIKPSANRYCEKSPANVKYLEIINELHQGNFKLIQIIRDGRDVILSKHPRKLKGYWVEPVRWIHDVSTGLKHLHNPKVLTIKYEDLVNDFNTCLNRICDYLDIENSPEIQSWYDNTTIRQYNALFANITEIHPGSIGKWNKPENEARVSLLTNDPDGKHLLKLLGYMNEK